MSTTPIITLSHLSKTFREDHEPEVPALHDIHLSIREGEFFIFVGPSGSGKSTLLRLISGLEKDYSGKVEFASGMRPKDMSFIFQQFALLPWLTVYENIELGLIAQHVSPTERKQRVARELKRLGLEKFAHAHSKELSGGMRQRVGIARALATDPKIIFMDEPFSELDSFTAEELRHEILQIWQERRPTIIMVTHIIEEALELADRIAVLTARPGKIEKIIHNTLPRPREKRSQEFFRIEDEIYNFIKP